MARKVFKEKLAQMQSWPFFVVAFQRGEFMALRKLAHDCVAVAFFGNQGLGNLVQGLCKPKMCVQINFKPYLVVAFQKGEYVALRKLANNCVAVAFFGNQGLGNLVQGLCKPKM